MDWRGREPQARRDGIAIHGHREEASTELPDEATRTLVFWPKNCLLKKRRQWQRNLQPEKNALYKWGLEHLDES